MRKRFAWALAMVLVSGLALLAASQSAQSAPSAMPVSQYTCGYWDPPGCGPGLPGCVWVPNPGPHCSTPVPATPRPPGPPPPPPPACNPIKQNPFTDFTVSDGTLTGNGCSPFSLSVTAPCLNVQRNPFPRGVVARENTFEVFPQPGSAESGTEVCGSPADCRAKGYGEQVRNVNVSLRLAIEPGVSPVWGWDERTWNVRSQRSSEIGWGWQSSHIYETSSFDIQDETCIRQYGEGSCRKPLNGPSLIAGEKLPAYQVTVSTPWKAFYKVDWEERTWECKCRPGTKADGNCCCDYVGPPSAHKTEEWDWCKPESDGRCWEGQSTGWQSIDLSRYTGGTWWMWSNRAKSVQQNVGCGVIPVPIIEIQGLLDP